MDPVTATQTRHVQYKTAVGVSGLPLSAPQIFAVGEAVRSAPSRRTLTIADSTAALSLIQL